MIDGELVLEVRALRELIEQLREDFLCMAGRRRVVAPEDREPAARLLAATYAAIGTTSFTVRSLTERASVTRNAALLDALAAIGTDPRYVGGLLRQMRRDRSRISHYMSTAPVRQSCSTASASGIRLPGSGTPHVTERNRVIVVAIHPLFSLGKRPANGRD